MAPTLVKTHGGQRQAVDSDTGKVYFVTAPDGEWYSFDNGTTARSHECNVIVFLAFGPAA